MLQIAVLSAIGLLRSNVCAQISVDAASRALEGGLNAYRGDAVQEFGNGESQAAKIADVYHEMLMKADAIFTWEPTNTVYAFKGDRVMVYNKDTKDVAQIPIKDAFAAFKVFPISDIDAVYSDVEGNSVAFFKGDAMYELDFNTGQATRAGKIGDLFPGVPRDITAAVKSGNFIYFFKGDQVFIYNTLTETTTVDPIREMYPDLTFDTRQIVRDTRDLSRMTMSRGDDRDGRAAASGESERVNRDTREVNYETGQYAFGAGRLIA